MRKNVRLVLSVLTALTCTLHCTIPEYTQQQAQGKCMAMEAMQEGSTMEKEVLYKFQILSALLSVTSNIDLCFHQISEFHLLSYLTYISAET